VFGLLSLVALGQGVVIVVRGLDFSNGSAVAISSVITVLTAPYLGIPASFLLGFAAVLGLGLLNGSLVSLLKLPAFLATLGTMIALHGLSSILAGGVPIEAPAGINLSILAYSEIGGLPTPIWIAALGFVLVGTLMQVTTFGRECYLIGSNPEAAHLAGVPVRTRILQAYLVNATLVGLAGAILTSRLGSGQPNLYPELPFEAIAACAIGGIPLTGGKGGPLLAAIGTLILALFVNSLVLFNFPSYLQSVLLGILIVCSVLLQRFTWPQRAVPSFLKNLEA
jgi:ribose transport system permease protein